MKYTEKQVRDLGLSVEPWVQGGSSESDCKGCVFNDGAVQGVKCADVPCTYITMGAEVIWVKRVS